MPDHTRTTIGPLLMLLLTTALVALALGALWTLLGAWWPGNVGLWAFGTAVGMIACMRFANDEPGWVAGVLAGLGTLVAAFYAESLQLMMRLAGQLGLPLIDVLHASGFGGTTQLTWRLMPSRHILIYAAVAIIAFVLTRWPRSRRTS